MWHKRKYSYEKVLRIGILHNNKMVQERLLMPDNSFSIGTHLGSDFIIQGIENHTLFYTKKGKYYIRGSHDLSGKILHKDKSIQNMISKETELSFNRKKDC